MIPTSARLTELERDFRRIDDAGKPRISAMLAAGVARVRSGTHVDEPLDIEQLEIDARQPGIAGQAAAGWLRIARWQGAGAHLPQDAPRRSTAPVAAPVEPSDLVDRIDRLLAAND